VDTVRLLLRAYGGTVMVAGGLCLVLSMAVLVAEGLAAALLVVVLGVGVLLSGVATFSLGSTGETEHTKGEADDEHREQAG